MNLNLKNYKRILLTLLLGAALTRTVSISLHEIDHRSNLGLVTLVDPATRPSLERHNWETI